MEANKNIFFGKDWLKLDNAAKVFPGQNTKQWSNVIRYSINLTVEVNPQILEKALKDILPRFPLLLLLWDWTFFLVSFYFKS